MEFLKTSYKTALQILENSEISEINKDITQNIFFTSNISEKKFKDIICDNKLDSEKREFMRNNNFPLILSYIYTIFGDSQREINYKVFSFLSLDNIINRYNQYTLDGQTQFLDIGIIYCGMGWVGVLTLDNISGKLFLRMDGGSNGYDREINYTNFKKLKISEKLKVYMFSFEEFIKLIDDDKLIDKKIHLENYV